jgi:hypothetical protein
VSLVSDFMARVQIDGMAKDLAAQFLKRVPVARAQDSKRIAAEFDTILGHARGMVREHHLGTYGKSRLANSFQWSLIESGYDRSMALQIGRDLASRLAERVHDEITK